MIHYKYIPFSLGKPAYVAGKKPAATASTTAVATGSAHAAATPSMASLPPPRLAGQGGGSLSAQAAPPLPATLSARPHGATAAAAFVAHNSMAPAMNVAPSLAPLSHAPAGINSLGSTLSFSSYPSVAPTPAASAAHDRTAPAHGNDAGATAAGAAPPAHLPLPPVRPVIRANPLAAPAAPKRND